MYLTKNNFTGNNGIYEQAVFYSQRGWKMIPVCGIRNNEPTCYSGKNCKSPGKHPLIMDWQKNASTDLSQIKEWLKEYPGANLGIVTGKGSGIWILDVDCKSGGIESLRKLEEKNGKLETMIVETGGGGFHYYFSYQDVGLQNSTGKIAPGIDFKTDGGFVVAPPSVHVNGNSYRRKEGDGQIAAMPEWLIELAKGSANDPDIISNGSRNNKLTSIAGGLRRQGCGETQILESLLEVNEKRCSPPLEKKEVEAIAKSVARYPTEEISFTDVANAERFIADHGDKVRYCHALKRWFIWNEKQWLMDKSNQIKKFAIETTKNLITRLVGSGKKVMNQANNCLNHKKLEYALSLSQHQAPIVSDDFDRHPWLLNANNGTLDLKKGELLPHNRDDFHTKLVPIDYDPEQECPTFMSFLDQIMDGNREMMDFLKRIVGYTLTGVTSEQCFFILYGTGRNGKSTFLEIIASLLDSYAAKAEMRTFLEKRAEQISNDIAALKGARLVSSVEICQNRYFNESLLKEITGGDKITARYLFSEYFTYTPQFKLFLATNNKPDIRENTEGLWRRIHLIPFEKTIPDDKIDKELLEKLKKELSGILVWAVNGCLEWQKAGLNPPDKAKNATQNYRKDMDILGGFFEEECVKSSDAYYSTAAEFYNAFKKWSEKNGHPPISSRKLGQMMTDRGYKSQTRKIAGRPQRTYQGVGLKSSDQSPSSLDQLDDNFNQ